MHDPTSKHKGFLKLFYINNVKIQNHIYIKSKSTSAENQLKVLTLPTVSYIFSLTPSVLCMCWLLQWKYSMNTKTLAWFQLQCFIATKYTYCWSRPSSFDGRLCEQMGHQIWGWGALLGGSACVELANLSNENEQPYCRYTYYVARHTYHCISEYGQVWQKVKSK
jgi:hypothetical protein